MTCFGLPGAVTIVSVLLANGVGVPVTRPASTAFAMFLSSAEAKTSPGAPWLSWATRSEEPPTLKLTVTPGWAASNIEPSSPNVVFSDAAAKTVSVPPPPEEGTGVGAPAEGAADGDVVPQAASTSPSVAMTTPAAPTSRACGRVVMRNLRRGAERWACRR